MFHRFTLFASTARGPTRACFLARESITAKSESVFQAYVETFRSVPQANVGAFPQRVMHAIQGAACESFAEMQHRGTLTC